MKFKSRFTVIMLLTVMLSFQGMITVSAANTVFDVPTISLDIKPNNMVYQSPNLNIIATKWSYGMTASIINTSNLDALIAELNDNVSAAGYSRAVVSIYPNGADLSDANIAALRNAGWNELDLYYYDFYVIGSMPEAGLSPNIELTENAEITNILEDRGNTAEVAMIDVSGINLDTVNICLYSKEFSFLNSNFYTYKYIADLGMFVSAGDYYIDSYGSEFLEIYDLQNIESDVNGFYIVMNEALPAELVTTAEELPALREDAKQTTEQEQTVGNQQGTAEKPAAGNQQGTAEQPAAGNQQGAAGQPAVGNQQTTEEQPVTGNQHTTEASQDEEQAQGSGNNAQEDTGNILPENNQLLFTNKDKSVQWKLGGLVQPEGFVPDAAVTVLNSTEVSVDFAYSGELPENTEVTVSIPDGKTNYRDGDVLFLYYCNPDTGQREYVGEGIYQDKQVTFSIYHCSEYIITSVHHKEAYTAEASGLPIAIFSVAGVMICCIGGVFIYKGIKKK